MARWGWTVVFAATFATLAAAVADGAAVVLAVDNGVQDQLRSFSMAHPAWLTTMSALTHLGDTLVVAAATAVGVVVLLARGRRVDAAFVVWATVAAYASSRLIRALIGRPRPEDRLWFADGSAFPSGHTTNAAAAAAIAVVVCWPMMGRMGRVAVVAGAIIYPSVVALTRLAGSVHWFSDVVGAGLLGVGCVAITAAAFRLKDQSSPPRRCHRPRSSG